jgi:hypothetical protein
MSSDDIELFATIFAGLGLFFLAGSTWLQYRESRKSRLLTEYQLHTYFIDRLEALAPNLAEVLEVPEDGVTAGERATFVGLFLTYAQARRAAIFGLYRNAEWDGLRNELAYWAEQPKAVRAMAELRKTEQAWPDGFFEFIDADIERYRRLKLK